MTDNDSSAALREPLLPLGGDRDETEEHPQRPCHTTSTPTPTEDEASIAEEANPYDDYPYRPGFVAHAERNVRNCLWILWGDMVTKSLWSETLVPLFLVLVWKDHPEYVGMVQATMGLAQTISAEVAEWSTRHYHHSVMVLLKLAFVGGVAAMGTSLVSILKVDPQWLPHQLDSKHVASSDFVWFWVANGLWGIFWGVQGVALPMMFVESASIVSKGRLRQVRTWHHRIVRLGSGTGVVLGLGVFGWHSQEPNTQKTLEWTVSSCATVLLLGVACNVCGVGTLLGLRSMAHDDWQADDEDVDPHTDEEEGCDPLLSPNDEELEEHGDDGYEESPAEEANEDTDGTAGASGCCPDHRMIPTLIYTADALSSLASGLSAWYLPVFLVVSGGMPPIPFFVVYGMLQVGQGLSPSLATGLANCIGPCRACILLQLTYVGLLLGMVACPESCSRWSPTARIATMGALYVLHGSLQNSTGGLTQALVARYSRWKDAPLWDGAELVQKVVWSACGILGGWVARQWGIYANLYATAVLQLLAGLPLWVLYCARDPVLETDDEDEDEEADDSIHGEDEGAAAASEDEASGNDEDESRGSHNSCPRSKAEAPIPSTPATEISESCESSEASDEDDGYYSAESDSYVTSIAWML